MNSLKIQKGYKSEAVFHRTDNTTTKRNMDRQYNDQRKHGHAIQRPKETWTGNTTTKRNMDKQWSTKHYTENKKNWKTQIPLKTGSELMYSGRIGSSCSTSATHRVTLVTPGLFIVYIIWQMILCNLQWGCCSQSLVFCVVFVLFVFCPFSVDQYPSMYSLWWKWDLQYGLFCV